MEDAAVLVNALRRKLDLTQQRLSTEDFQEVFAEAQISQENRTQHLLEHSSRMQSVDAMESVFSPLIVKFVIPSLTDDAALAIVGANTVKGQRIKPLQVPKRARYVPYDDELPSKPLRNLAVSKACVITLYMVLLYLAHLVPSASGSIFDIIGNELPKGYIDPIIHNHTTIGETSESQVFHSLSSVMSLIPAILIWNLEGRRRGNIRSVGSWYVYEPHAFSSRN